MVKVICVECKDVGYTASPEYVRCQCGNKLTVISDNLNETKTRGDEYASVINS